jgi:hypothetical protein
MNAKRLLIGTGAAAITIVVAGMAIFSLPPLARLYGDALTSGSATGVPRQVPVLWAAALGAASYGALVTLAVMGRTCRQTMTAGVKAGAVVGFLLWFTADLMLYAISNVGSLSTLLIATVVELIPGALAGGVIVMLFPWREAAVAVVPPRRTAA